MKFFEQACALCEICDEPEWRILSIFLFWWIYQYAYIDMFHLCYLYTWMLWIYLSCSCWIFHVLIVSLDYIVIFAKGNCLIRHYFLIFHCVSWLINLFWWCEKCFGYVDCMLQEMVFRSIGSFAFLMLP